MIFGIDWHLILIFLVGMAALTADRIINPEVYGKGKDK